MRTLSAREILLTQYVCAIFQGRLDKSGVPYVEHSIRVAQAAASFGRDCQEAEILGVIGLCHDLLEDTNTTWEILKALGVTNHEYQVIQVLSNNLNGGPKESDYETFINKVIEGGFFCVVVKLCDNMHNLSRDKHKSFKFVDKLKSVSLLSRALIPYMA